MRPRSIILLVVTVLIVGFAALNWSNMLITAPIHLVVAKIEAPLGILFLLVVSGMLLLFFAVVAVLEAQARSERKRLSDDVERWRKLAEEAEASRIEQLRQIIEAGFDDLYDRMQRLGGSPPPEALPEPEEEVEAAAPPEQPEDEDDDPPPLSLSGVPKV